MASLCFRLNIIIICYVRFIKVDFLIMAWLSNEFAVAFVTEYYQLDLEVPAFF
jgi:hypothetical protein